MKRKRLLILLLLCIQNSYAMDPVCERSGNGEMTPLMSAVRNNNLDKVESLLKEGANFRAYNLQEKSFVRNFNLIYKKDRLIEKIGPIVRLLLELETYNRLERDKDKRIDYYVRLNELQEAKDLRKALLIDKKIEDAEQSAFLVQHTEFIILLKRHAAIKRAIKKMFSSIEEIKLEVPMSISNFLVIFEEPQNPGPSRPE